MPKREGVRILGMAKQYYRPYFFRAILIIFMLCVSTGFLKGLWNYSGDPMTIQERVDKTRQLMGFVDSRLEVAKQKAVYTPYDYFSDLDRVYEFGHRIGFGQSVYASVGNLQGLMQKNLGSKFSYDDIEKAKAQFKGKLDDRLSHRSEFFQMLGQMGWIGFLTWLFGVYLWNLIPVALLLLMWMYESQIEKEQGFRFPNPAFFL